MGNNLIGQKFERLTVIGLMPNSKKHYICKCDCGEEVLVYESRLICGKIKSCGCLNDEKRKLLPQYTIKHGMTNTILYSKYCSMKERCHNPNYVYYHRYGGRGIKICKEWEESFEAFVKWAYENGYDENKTKYEQTLDRIDNDKDYCPENCKWSSQKEQVKNRSNSIHIIYEGEDLNCTEFARKYNIDSEAFVRRRHIKGQPPEQIISDWNALKSKDYISLSEATKIYGISRATMYKRIYSGEINAKKVGQKWLIAC